MNDQPKIPVVPHFAIIRTRVVYVPGTEGSGGANGYANPAHAEEYITYEAFTDRSKWEAVILNLVQMGREFRAISATPAKVMTNVTVSVT
ncbi:MAG: hypothetical protein ACRYG8_32105 [Janthinobacterium lividum]